MKLYTMSIKAEFTSVQRGFQYRIALSPNLDSARFLLSEQIGISLGYPDDPSTIAIRNLTISERSVGFVVSGDADRLVFRFSILSSSPVLFGQVAMPDGTLLTLSNRDTSINVWGNSVWVLPIDYWQSPTINAFVEAEILPREPAVALEQVKPPKTT